MKQIQIHPLDDWGFFFDVESGHYNEVSNQFTNLYTIYESDEDENTTNCLNNYMENKWAPKGPPFCSTFHNFVKKADIYLNFTFLLNLFSKVK
jgi:hypothetical protein